MSWQSPTPRSQMSGVTECHTLVIVFKLSSENKEPHKIQRTFSQAGKNKTAETRKLFILPFDSGFWVLNLSGRSSLASDEDQSREMNWNGWWEFVAKSFIPGLPRKICPIGIPWHPSILFVFVTWALSNSMSESQPAISRYLLWLFGSLRARQINN